MLMPILRQTLLSTVLLFGTVTDSTIQGEKESSIHKDSESADQLFVTPDFTIVKGHPRTELGNRISVKLGSSEVYDGVKVTKIDGPGEIKQLDSEYFWFWNPRNGDAGKSYIVIVSASLPDGHGHKYKAAIEFSVFVTRIQYAVQGYRLHRIHS
jgi:hypothetical protein